MKLQINTSSINILLIVLVGTWIYVASVNSAFVFDDEFYIAENPTIKNLQFFTSSPKKHELYDVYHLLKLRYIGYLSFALNYKLHGLDVRGYHLANISIHLLNAVFVYLLVCFTFKTPFLRYCRLSSHAENIGLFSALFFVSHPLQTEAVTYISQRLASLVTLFYLLSLLLYIKWRLSGRWWVYLSALLSALLAMKTKELAFTLPVAIALYEGFFFDGKPTRRALFLLPFFLTMLIVPLAVMDLGMPLSSVIGEATRTQHVISRHDYLLTQFRVIITYLRLLVLPINQNLDYDYPIKHSLFDPEVLSSFVLLLGLVVLGTALLVRSKEGKPALRIAAYGIFWFFITISVESSFIALADIIFEHRLYLPSAWGIPAVLMLVFHLGQIWRLDLRGITIGTCLLVLLFSIAAFERNTKWSNDLAVWMDVSKKSPNKARAFNNLGMAYEKRSAFDKAEEAFRKALAIEPSFLDAWVNLGVMHENQGRYAEAELELRTVVSANPENARAHYNLGVVYARTGRYQRAMEEYLKAISFNQYHADAHNNLGSVYIRQGRYPEALKEFQTAVSLDPLNEGFRRNLRFVQDMIKER